MEDEERENLLNQIEQLWERIEFIENKASLFEEAYHQLCCTLRQEGFEKAQELREKQWLEKRVYG